MDVKTEVFALGIQVVDVGRWQKCRPEVCSGDYIWAEQASALRTHKTKQSVICFPLDGRFLHVAREMHRMFVFIICCAWSNAHAQTPVQDSVLAERYKLQALGCIQRGQTDSAIQWHRQALNLFQKNNLTQVWYKSYRELAEAWVNQKQPFVALEYLAPVIREKMSAARTKDESGRLMGLCIYSGYICEVQTGDLEGAVEYYEQTYQLFTKDLGESSVDFANYLYHRLGNLYTRLGDYERALNVLKRGIEYGKRINKPEIGKYGDLAISLNDLGKYKEALEIVRQGLAIPQLPLQTLITTRLSEARAWLGLGDVQNALEANEKVPPLTEKLKEGETNKEYYLAGYYSNLGAISESLGKFDEAVENYRKAIQNELAMGFHRRETGKAHFALGEFYLRHDQPAKALEEYQLTLQSVLTSFHPQSLEDNPHDSLFTKAENTIIEGLLGKARCFEALGNLAKTLECYELIPLVEAKLLSTHAYESSSLLTLDESRPRLERAIGIAWKLFAETGNQQYVKRAFHLTEQARGILLLQTMLQAQADYKLGDSIRNLEKVFRVKKAWYDQQIAEEKVQDIRSDSLRLEKLESELLNLIQEESRFQARLARDNPGYTKLLDKIKYQSVADIPRLLRPNQVFVDYFITDETVYIFVVDSKGSLAWHKADLPPDFRDSMVQRFVEYLAGGEGKGDAASVVADQWFKRAAADLYQLLMAPVVPTLESSSDALIIVPDDVLAFMPFELLLPKPSQDAWPELPFLVKKYSISYAYSATLLERQQANMRDHSAANRIPFAGFAPAYKNARDPQTGDLLYPISGMEGMAQKVRALLGGKVFRGDEATEQEFERTAPTCRVLLLAMHGFANENEPALSRLLFGNPSKTGTPDNVLYTNELQVSYLPVDLVVLNACYTGFGKLHRGEGVYSLTRALTSAGVPATVMSIWQLSGSSSPVLIETFFQNLQKGMPKDVALQQAKIELLNNPEYDSIVHPGFWGGLLATGDMSALQF